VPLLLLVEGASLNPVGHRQGRRSLAADVQRASEILFRVHFDASDGKCSIRNLKVQNCGVLREWEKERASSAVIAGPDPDA
jgi:hypothetical protein